MEKQKVRIANAGLNQVKYVSPEVADSPWLRNKGWVRQEMPTVSESKTPKMTDLTEKTPSPTDQPLTQNEEQSFDITSDEILPADLEKVNVETPAPKKRGRKPATAKAKTAKSRK